MTPVFEPFQDRLSRDIRNGLSSAFIEAVDHLDPKPFRQVSAVFLHQASEPCYREYIEERVRRYETAMNILSHGPGSALWRAAVLWDLQLFFEVHELLEKYWIGATGGEKLLLQALIRAAGVYIKLEYGYREAATRMAARALPVLTVNREVLSQYLDPAPLLKALTAPAIPAPRLHPR